MAQVDLKLTVRVNQGRMRSLMQQAFAAVRRAKKGDRPAIIHRFGREIAAKCVRPVVS